MYQASQQKNSRRTVHRHHLLELQQHLLPVLNLHSRLGSQSYHVHHARRIMPMYGTMLTTERCFGTLGLTVPSGKLCPIGTIPTILITSMWFVDCSRYGARFWCIGPPRQKTQPDLLRGVHRVTKIAAAMLPRCNRYPGAWGQRPHSRGGCEVLVRLRGSIWGGFQPPFPLP